MSKQYKSALDLPNADARARKLVEIATKQEAAGDALGADKSLKSAASSAEQIDSPSMRASVLAAVAQAQGARGRKSDAKALLKQAREAYKTIEKPFDRIAAVLTCAETYALHLDSAAIAKGELREAESLIEGMDPPQLGIQAAGQIAACYFNIGAEQDGNRVLDNTVEKANAMSDPRKKADTLVEIASVLSDTEQKDRGTGLLTEAKAAVETIDDVQSKGFALANLAEAYAAYRQIDEARSLLDQASDLAQQVDSSLRNDLTDRIDRVRKKM